MVFCSNCSEELPENAYFCPKCGVKTSKGVEVGVSTSWKDLEDAFSRMGEEMRKAFSIAAIEMEKAFKTAGETVRKATRRETLVCAHCGEKNFGYARFCHNCGKKLE